MSSEPLLSVQGLKKYFDDDDSILDSLLGTETAPVRAIDGVDFDVHEGETFGLVGESGCGKSTTGQTILRLLEPTAGHAYFDGRDIYEMDRRELNGFRRNAQIVFQDPFSSLNPRMTIDDIVKEPLKIHGVGTKQDRREKVAEMLEHVGLSADQMDRYPHEFSGGQRQRICIARALALEPDFIVLDEPVSSLDVSVQAQILNLLDDLQDEFDLTYLFIAHDLGVVQYICDRVGVMYLGRIVEYGPTDDIFERPGHPYTRALLDSIPEPDYGDEKAAIDGLSGEVPSPREPPTGCSFHTRCEEIILPPSLDVEKETFRTVADFRHQLATDPGRFEEYAVSDPSGATDDVIARQTRELREAYDLGAELADGTAERALADAMTHIAGGETEQAASRLDEVFTTVCRRHDPELKVATSEGHRAACFHVYDDLPDETVEEAPKARQRGD